MKLQLFSLFDIVGNAFGAPFVAVNKESALRSVISESQNPAAGPLYSHPTDFRVFYLGEFDNESGEFAVTTPHFLANVATVKDDQS